MKNILDKIHKQDKTIAKTNLIGYAIFLLFFLLFYRFSDSMFIIFFPFYGILIFPFFLISLAIFREKARTNTDKMYLYMLIIGLILNIFQMFYFLIWIVSSCLH